MGERLKAPFPWFGGKKAVAARVWSRLGDVANYVEPFAGSLAVMLLRPSLPRIETVNDLDCYVANFWRATQHDPEAVASFADEPVSEVDLHSRHRWLVLSDDAAAFRQRMRTDPGYFDARVAGWWCWGLCCWIGSGWCAVTNQTGAPAWEQKPALADFNDQNKVNPTGDVPTKMPTTPRPNGGNTGGNYKGCLKASDANFADKYEPPDNNRPQLADAYDIGRGVNSRGDLGTCAARRAWLIDWFSRLRDRLRTVRVCCGDWSRVCSSESVTTRLGTTGVFLDPPYGTGSDRNENLYSVDSMTVAAEVRRWCLENGQRVGMKICLAGYAGEGHEELETADWLVESWKASGGYGNRSEKGKGNAAKERLWFSPHCHAQKSLFDVAETEPQENP